MESQYFAAVAIHAGALRDEDMGVIELAKRKIPVSMQIGDSDPLVLKIVRATRDALKDAGVYRGVDRDREPRSLVLRQGAEVPAKPPGSF